jgi:uncharacterized membrane protein YgcG
VRKLFGVSGVVLITSALAWALGMPAVSGQGLRFESTPSFDVRIVIEPSGALEVTETIVQDFGDVPRHGIFRYIPSRLLFDDTHDRVYPIDLISVTTTRGAPNDVETSEEGGNFVIRIGHPDVTITGKHTYTIVYRVEGAMNGFETHQELYWNAIGTDWEQPIGQMRVRVEAPAPVERIACFQGPFGSTLGCTREQIRDGAAVFVQDDLGSFTAMSVVVALPLGTVASTAPILEERWSMARAFSATPSTMGGALVLFALVVGGFSWLVWRRGRDVRFAGSQVDQVMGGPIGAETQAVPLFESGQAPVEFAPPAGLRPGQVGTLVDEEAHTIDVSATIVDLAVRKFLVIEEIEKKWFLGKPDWKLTRLPAPTDGLLAYERSLLDGLFEDGSEVELSDLRKKFAPRLQKVKEALYEDVVAKKWFLRRPDKVRQMWVGIALAGLLLGIGATVLLAWRTKLALLGVPLVIGGLLLLFGAKRMPARTASGTAITRRVNGFRIVIETAEEHTAKWAEQENVFTRFLPYAVVFGVTDKWARTFESLGVAQAGDMSWYVSSRPFAYLAFADSLDSFAVTTSGVISSTPSGSGGSGFGGGGFSGGGGGGGGGGSW